MTASAMDFSFEGGWRCEMDGLELNLEQKVY